MYWEVVKRQSKTGMYAGIVKIFEFNEKTRETSYDKALQYSNFKNKLNLIKKHYYEVEFNYGTSNESLSSFQIDARKKEKDISKNVVSKNTEDRSVSLIDTKHQTKGYVNKISNTEK